MNVEELSLAREQIEASVSEDLEAVIRNRDPKTVGDVLSTKKEHIDVPDDPERTTVVRREFSEIKQNMTLQAHLMQQDGERLQERLNNLPDHVLKEPLTNLPFDVDPEHWWTPLEDLLRHNEHSPVQSVYSLVKRRFHTRHCIAELKENVTWLKHSTSIFSFWKKKIPEFLPKAFLDLTPDRLEVLNKRFCLFRETRNTLVDAGASLGVTRERVRQIQEEALQDIDPFYLNGVNVLIDRILEDRGGIISFDQVLEMHRSSKEELRADHHWGFFRINGILKILKNIEKYGFQLEGDLLYHSALTPDRVQDISGMLIDVFEEIGDDVELDRVCLEIDRRLDGMDPSNFNRMKPFSFESMVEKLMELEPKIGSSPFDTWGLKRWPHISPSTHAEWGISALRRIGQPVHWEEIHRKAEELSGKTLHRSGFKNALQSGEGITLFKKGKAIYGLDEMAEDYEVEEYTSIPSYVYKKLREDGKQSKEQLIEHVLRQGDYSESSVRSYVSVDPRVVERDSGTVLLHRDHEKMGEFSRGRGRWGGLPAERQVEMAEEVLRDAENPLKLIVVARRMSIRYEEGPFLKSNLKQILSNPDTVVFIGQNFCALTEDGYREMTPVEALKNALHEKEGFFESVDALRKQAKRYRRMTVEQIYRAFRNNEEFVRTNDWKYGLKKYVDELEGGAVSESPQEGERRKESGDALLPLG